MKKANIILSAIGLLSVIGGALAFKAQNRFSGQLFCYTTVGSAVGTARIYKAVPFPAARYTTDQLGTTLFCTIPTAPNKTYNPIKVDLNN